MRVLLWTDMEGMAQVIDHRECWPVFPHYWRAGRRKFTADVVAAANGLLAGGATEVVVVNGHGLGWPNLLVEALPARVIPFEDDTSSRAFDALFQVGFHARCGTSDGFVSHTFVPGLRMAVDGALITESHAMAWRVGVPVLGITGDASLEAQLDGTLAGTPFLPVKRSTSREETMPLYANAIASDEAIARFSRRCAQDWRQRRTPALPARFTVTLSLDPALADLAVGRHGLVRTSPAVLSVEANDWEGEVDPAAGAAMGAALQPLFQAQGDLDLSSEEAMLRQDPAQLAHFRRFFCEWVQAPQSDWEA